MCICKDPFNCTSCVFLPKHSLLPSIRQCRAHLEPSPIQLIHLVPNINNYAYCLHQNCCIKPLYTSHVCTLCQLRIITTDDDRCYQVCSNDKRCGVLCLQPKVSFFMKCDCDSNRLKNVTCGCIKYSTNVQNMDNQQDYCQHTVLPPTTTPRWMQKSGFPAAGILLLVIIGAAVIIALIKFIHHHLHGVPTSVNNTNQNIVRIYNHPSTVPICYQADISDIGDNHSQYGIKLRDSS
ncbi:unnamed protein product [Didymodactylos carnosus]|uniref:Uncharacterized protein n=1 Tax=Didymodactylos carnosus TaxID=1234261 RepID=A0A814D6Q3_9BILA|nr:unnamed protein product [Didymodactylos carnosus]CAF3726785.1 unnamed protein product [Didymodactylos carnosus]